MVSRQTGFRAGSRKPMLARDQTRKLRPMKSHSALLARIFRSSHSRNAGSVQEDNCCVISSRPRDERPVVPRKVVALVAKRKCRQGTQMQPARKRATRPARMRLGSEAIIMVYQDSDKEFDHVEGTACCK